MNSEPMSLDESFHNCFFYFMQAVDVLSVDAAEQCKTMDDFNVAGEIQQDVLNDGVALINWPEAYLSMSEKNLIAQLLNMLAALPVDALLGQDNKKDMSHPAWADIRIAATALRAQLDNAVKRNRDFFDAVKRDL